MEINSCIRQYADHSQITRCKERVNHLNPAISRLAHSLELAGNNVRLKILFLLNEEGRLCVCDISDILEMTVPAVSQHLRKMKDRNLIQSTKEAQTIFYTLAPEFTQLLAPFFEIIIEKEALETV